MISNSAGKAEMSDADIGILIVLHEMLCYDKEVIDDDGEVHSLLGRKPPAYRVIKPRVPPPAVQCRFCMWRRGDSPTTAQARARKPHKQLPLSFNYRRLGSITL
jgi:hypothetical protein